MTGRMTHAPYFPAQIGLTTIFMLVLVFSSMYIWYACQPAVYKILALSESITQDLGVNTTGSAQTFTILRYVSTLFVGVIVVVIFIAWGLASSQKEEYRGDVYGY